jgi:hypothetical protein
LFHPDIVELKKVYLLGSQSPQSGLSSLGDGLGGEILRDFTLASPFASVVKEVVSDFGRDYDLVPALRKRFSDQLFAQPIAVCICSIEERNTQIQSSVHQSDSFCLGEVPPPPGRQSPHSKADLAHSQISIPVLTIFHSLQYYVEEISPQALRALNGRFSGLPLGRTTDLVQKLLIA